MENKLTIAITLDLPEGQNPEEIIRNVQAALEHASNVADNTQEIIVEELDSERAKKVLKEAGYLMVFWCEDDIRGYELGENGYDDKGEVIPPLTDEEVCDIMLCLENNFDASIGINWDTISSQIWDILEARKDS